MNGNGVLVNITGGTTAFQNASIALPADVLTVPRADKIYVNEKGDKLSGDLNMQGNQVKGIGDPKDNGDAVSKSYLHRVVGDLSEFTKPVSMGNNRITNLGNPVDNQDATNKVFVDTKLEEAKRFVETKLIDNQVIRRLNHDYIMNEFKPVFWISSQYKAALGIREQTSKYIGPTARSFAIISKYEFGTEFTFIARANRKTPGRVLTSLTGNKFFGFWKDRIDVLWYDGPIHNMTTQAQPDTIKTGEYETVYILVSSNSKLTLYNNKTKIIEHTSTSNKSWSNLVIGDTMFNEGADYDLYYCMGFNRKLSKQDIENILSIIDKK
jgi:hypothetical protein